MWTATAQSGNSGKKLATENVKKVLSEMKYKEDKEY